MRFKSKLDYEKQTNDQEQVNKDNCEVYLKQWLESLNDDLVRFFKFIGTKNILSLELDDKDLLDLSSIIHQWVVYATNCFRLHRRCEKISIEHELVAVIQLVEVVQQFNESTIKKVDEFQRPFSQRYLQTYITNQSNQLITEIEKTGKILRELRIKIHLSPIPMKDLYERTFELMECLTHLIFLLKSLTRLNSQRARSSPISDFLAELGITQAKDCMARAVQFFDEERWDKTVFEMRRAFEIVVTWLVRKIQHDSNWKAPLKDGLHILRQKGIITDDFILNQIRVKDVGLHGLLSIKGVHPNGCSTENFADSDIEATYCMELANSAITYLLESFKKSSFYEVIE